MVTNNYWKMIYAYGRQLDNAVRVTDIDNNTWSLRIISSQQNFLDSLDIIIGKGTTTPTKTDTKLSNMITNMSNISTTVNISYNENGLTIMGTITGDNQTLTDVTITEVGITYPLYTNLGGIVGYALAAHALLNTPITVPSGQGFSVTVEMTET